MIEITDKSTPKSVYFPKNLTETGTDFVLGLHSELTGRDFQFEVTNESSGGNYYKFTVDFSSVPDGEYNWSILSSGEIHSEGILRIGNWVPAVSGSEYTLIQYDETGYSPLDMQSKQIEINEEGLTVVEPDAGYVGLKRVEVVVDVPTDWSEAYEAGEAAQKAKLVSTAITENGTYAREDGFSSVDVNIPVDDWYNSGYTSGYSTGYDEGYTSGSSEGEEEGYESGYTSGYSQGQAAQKALLVSTAITENGTYTKEDGYNSVSVAVPTEVNNETKTVEYTSNGTYIVTPGSNYTGLRSVTVRTNVPTSGHSDEEITQAYESGVTEGIAEQLALLVSTAITENGTYTRENGFNSVEVNVPQTGSTINNQDKTVSISQSGTTSVSADAGYTGLGTVTINPGALATASYNSGVAAQKALLVSTAVTENGTYTRENGYSSIEVNVPQTGGTVNNQDKTVSYSLNGTYTVTPDSGYSGLGTVTVEVATSGSTPTSTVSVTLMNETLIGQAGFTFTYDGGSTAYTFDTSVVTITGLLPGMGFIVSYDAVGGYTTPESYAGVTYYGNTNHITVQYVPYGGYYNQYFTIEAVSGTTGSISFSDLLLSADLHYSINDGEWQTMTSATTISGLTTGDKIRFKGVNNQRLKLSPTSGNGFYLSNLKWNVYGNIMSLVAGDDFAGVFTIPGNGDYMFSRLFVDNRGLLDASNLILPMLNLTPYCYYQMFQSCSALTSAPELPATTLASYCYNQMFNGCGSLTTAPELPATTLAEYCYYSMFSGCASLTTAPELPATTLAESCYFFMFANCTGLVTAPELPATTLAKTCYAYMFRNCTVLTTAPVLPAPTTVNGAYNYMFYGCTFLNYVKCLLVSRNNPTYGWLNEVASSGTFVKAASMTSWPTGGDGIPSGWTVVDAD